MWRNFEPQTQNKRREKKLCSDSYAIGPRQQTNLRIYQLVGLVNGQQTLERIVLAAKPVRLRKEGLGSRVNPNADPMSKGLPHHLCCSVWACSFCRSKACSFQQGFFSQLGRVQMDQYTSNTVSRDQATKRLLHEIPLHQIPCHSCFH